MLGKCELNEKLGRESERKRLKCKEGCQCPGVRGQLRNETTGSLGAEGDRLSERCEVAWRGWRAPGSKSRGWREWPRKMRITGGTEPGLGTSDC